MSKTKEQKAKIIDRLIDKFNQAKIVVFSSYNQRGKKGLSAESMRRLKINLSETNSEYIVSKKTLIDIAVKNSDNIPIDLKNINVRDLEGSLGILFGYGDIVEPLKIVSKISNENKSLVLYFGFSGREFLTNNDLIDLANLPSKEFLISKFIYDINYPIFRLINILKQNLINLVGIFNQRITKIKH